MRGSQFTKQRISRPDYGLREDVLLPWYATFAAQYIATPYNSWTGNRSLIEQYESLAWYGGEDRYGKNPHIRWELLMAADSAEDKLAPEEVAE